MRVLYSGKVCTDRLGKIHRVAVQELTRALHLKTVRKRRE